MWSKLREVDQVVWLSAICWLCALLIFEWRWSVPPVVYLLTLPAVAKAYMMVFRNPTLIMTPHPAIPYIYMAVFTALTICLGPIGLAFILGVIGDQQRSIYEKWRKGYVESIERYGHPIRCFINPQLAELIETERSYLYSLRELESRILTPLQQAPETAGLRAEDVKRIVAQFPEVIGLVQCFVDRLDACLDNEGVVNAFLDFSQHFKMYSTLCVNLFGNRPWVRLQMLENRCFRTLVQSALKDATYQSLDDYFIMPVQRVTRYPLLFKDVDARCCVASENLARHVNQSMDLEKTVQVPIYSVDLAKEALLASNRRLRLERTCLLWACASLALAVCAQRFLAR
jgi:hypothetical protein